MATSHKSKNQARFPADWFPYGATLVSTMTRWGHCGQKLDEWIREISFDLESMAARGMTSVSVLLDWEMVEPEADNFDFSRFDPIMEKADALGLRVVLWPWDEVQPEWVAREHPDWCWEADDGSRPPLGCWHHDEFRDRVHLFLRRLVERYRDNPAMFMWNVSIEPHYRVGYHGRSLSEPRIKLYCYQPATVGKFRKWLKAKYKDDLDLLNRRWVSHYATWDDVVPVRHGHNMLSSGRFMDWRMFWIDANTVYQHGKAALVSELDPAHPTTGNVGSGFRFDSVFSADDTHKLAPGFDSYGLSRFPIYRTGRDLPFVTQLAYTDIRSACGPDHPFFIHELQGGPQVLGLHVGQSPTPQEIAQWSWQSVGAGFSGIWFWAWRPHRGNSEVGGFGLTNMDGSDTSRVTAAETTSRQLQKIAPLLNRLRPVQPKVAILYSHLNNIFCWGAGSMCNDKLAGRLHLACMQGYFKVLNKLGIPVHILHEYQLDQLTDGNLSHIKALILPYTPVLEPEHLDSLNAFCLRGKMIWSDPWLAQRDGANAARDTVPGSVLTDCFGCTQGQVYPILADTAVNRANEWRGSSVTGSGRCRIDSSLDGPVDLTSAIQEVSLQAADDAEVIGTFESGRAGLIRKQDGGCTRYFAGSLFSLPDLPQISIGGGSMDLADSLLPTSQEGKNEPDNSGFQRLFGKVLTDAGIIAPIEIVGGDNQREMETHLLVGKDEALAIFINGGPDKIAGRWRIRTDFNVDDKTRAVDLLTDKPVDVISRDKSAIEISLNLPRYGIATVWMGEKLKL